MAASDDPLLAAFANVLRRRRQAAGLSQEELAHRAGVSIRYVSLLESRRHQPSLATLKGLADGLETPLGAFAGEIEAELTAAGGRAAGWRGAGGDLREGSAGS